jgi:hypothetical protein
LRERGRGGLLFAMGASAKFAVPRLTGAGIALSAVRSYVHSLNAALGDSGVYAGSLLIGALIENSAAHSDAARWADGDRPMAVVSGDGLADRLWDMYVKRDRVEDVVAPGFAE